MIVDYLELIFSNYNDKPKDGEYHAHLTTRYFLIPNPYNVENIIWKKSAVSSYSKKETEKENIKGMQFIFIDGIIAVD